MLHFRWKWLYGIEMLVYNMRSTKDISNLTDGIEEVSEIDLPKDQTVQGNVTKAKCGDPSHGDTYIREGERVYAVLVEENTEISLQSIACRECSARSIYESQSKDTQLYIVSGIIEPSQDKPMKLTRMQVLDEYSP